MGRQIPGNSRTGIPGGLGWLGDRKGIRPVKTEWWDVGVVVCLGQSADLPVGGVEIVLQSQSVRVSDKMTIDVDI